MVPEFDANPTLPGIADPYPIFRDVRERDPVHWCPGAEVWAITRYADAELLLKDPRLSRQAFLDRVETRMGHQSITDMQRHELVFMDNPRHRNLRTLLGEAITPAAIQQLRPQIAEHVERRLRGLAPRGRLEVIGEFLRTLPTEIASMWLGVPEPDRPMIVEWIFPLVAGRGVTRDAETVQAANRAADQFNRYLSDLMAERRRDPKDDLISAFLRMADTHPGSLSDAEVLSLIIAVFAAGHGPGIAMVANTLLALLRHPEALAEAQADPKLTAGTLEEGLRFDPPTQAPNPLTALEDIDIGGKTIRRGDTVSIIIAAANRDPEAFPEPDRFDIRRHPNRHLSFSGGEHYCLGAQLARVEGQHFLGALLTQLPELRLGCAEAELRWIPHDRFRTLERLPVVYRV